MGGSSRSFGSIASVAGRSYPLRTQGNGLPLSVSAYGPGRQSVNFAKFSTWQKLDSRLHLSKWLYGMTYLSGGRTEAAWLVKPAAVWALILAQQLEIEQLLSQLTSLATEIASLRERIRPQFSQCLLAAQRWAASNDGPGFRPPERCKGSGRKRYGQQCYWGSCPELRQIESVEELVEHHPEPLRSQVMEIPIITQTAIKCRLHQIDFNLYNTSTAAQWPRILSSVAAGPCSVPWWCCFCLSPWVSEKPKRFWINYWGWSTPSLWGAFVYSWGASSGIRQYLSAALESVTAAYDHGAQRQRPAFSSLFEGQFDCFASSLCLKNDTLREGCA